MLLPVEKQDTNAIEQDLRGKINAIALIEVVDAATFEAAGANVKAITAVEKSWEAYWEPLREAARATLDGILGKKKGPLDLLGKRKDEQKAKMKAWADAEEIKRKEAERVAQEAARKLAEDQALADAAELEKRGDKAGAEAVLANPTPAPQVVQPTVVPKGFGTSLRKFYSAEVTDIMALARAVLAKEVPAQALAGNIPFLNAQAILLKETMKWPGVKVNVR